jgi:hypothetical protein
MVSALSGEGNKSKARSEARERTMVQKKYVVLNLCSCGQQTVEIWLEGLDFPLLLVKRVFKYEDGTFRELYLVCSNLNLSYEQITIIYKKRWGVEIYHKSTKGNGIFAKTPTKNNKETNEPFYALYN